MKQHAFLMDGDETAPTAALEQVVGNSVDDLLEDDSADPQFSERPRIVDEKERRDVVVPTHVSLVSDFGVFVAVLSCAVGSNAVSPTASRRRALASALVVGV